MDPAFVWQRPSPPPPPRGWITLEQASDLAGVPATTIRNWARKRKVSTKMDGDVRLVLRDDVIERAHHLGHPHSRAKQVPPAQASPPTPPEPPVPEGSMLVPVDEWRRILNQLGNLHEAGQQLADARERAAKAETEAQFLKERVRELRGRLEDAAKPPPAPPQPAPRPEPVPSADPVPETRDPGPFWLYIVRRWGTRKR
ncbi:MAG: helix-turn-helix domain-containing protein [Actinobacteria bacterium]|nr:helix-turn-helix domain-containing protein [Actinomycetota bacterium]